MTRYLLRGLLSATVFVAVTLAAVIWLTQSLKLLELIANSDAPAGIFVQLVALTLPRFLEIILPLSLVAAILFIYHKLIQDNELIVMRSCGFDHLALARPALLLAGSLTIVLMALTTYISPRCQAEMQVIRQDIKARYSSFLLREGVFNTFGDGLTVYLRRRGKTGDLEGLMIHDSRDKAKPPITVTAKRGRIVTEGEAPTILVFDGLQQQMNEKGKTVSRLFFSRYAVEIKGLEGSAKTRWREPSERTLFELIKPDLSNKKDAENRPAFLVEAHHRILKPFNALGFSFAALSCILLGPFNRRGQAKKILAGAAIVVLLQSADLSLVNAAKNNLALVPLFYLVTLAPVFFGLYLLDLQGEVRLKALLRQWRLRGYVKEGSA